MKHTLFRTVWQRADGIWHRWIRFLVPTLFFTGTIYYEELFLKLFCFGTLTPQGALFTLLFSLLPACLLGCLCGILPRRWGKAVLIAATFGSSVWMATQSVYYHLFKTFMTVFSLTKMGMVAGAFGGMALTEIVLNWFPILTLLLPMIPALLFQDQLVPDGPRLRWDGLCWIGLAALLQISTILTVLCCDQGILSLRYIYTQAAVPELEVQHFGMFTQTQLELLRVVYGIQPDTDYTKRKKQLAAPVVWREDSAQTAPSPWTHNVLNLNFHQLTAQEEDKELLDMHQYFSQVEPTEKNQWTGYFEGKNLVWIVAEGFCSQVLDPQRTPTLYQMANSGFIFDNFYTPLWGVSTSDGEYVTTTGLIPKSGTWSYSQSAENYMPFGFGNQFASLGYTTLAYHNYLYNYYDRHKSYPNMGYDYRAIGQGLNMELKEQYPSDWEMMRKIIPDFIGEDPFMVYCLTVSGHLNYSVDENSMCRRHWSKVEDLPYSEAVRCYLACQMELELAVSTLVRQLEAAGKLEDTVIAISGDHYPYGLTDEQYSELLGHPVDPVFEIYENSFILWNSAMEEPVAVEKYCSSLDIMPTLANLFNLEYDSRLIAGRDILSDSPGLVIFSNYSFLTDIGAYNSLTDTFSCWDGSSPAPGYVAEMVTEVQNRVAYSAAILDHDYYRVVLGPTAKKTQ